MWRLVTPSSVAYGEDHLDPTDRERRDRFTHIDARDHLVASRGLLVDALSLTGVANDFRIERGDKGKPHIVGGPAFNLSHSHGVAAVAVQTAGEECSLGVDVEAPWRNTDHDAISRRFFAESERRFLESGEEPERRERFFELWTLKEAVLKATGKGLTQPLASVEFTYDGGWQLCSGLGGEWSLGQWTLPSGHVIAAAADVANIDWSEPREI